MGDTITGEADPLGVDRSDRPTPIRVSLPAGH